MNDPVETDQIPAAAPAGPPAPEWRQPERTWEHRALYDRVIQAMYALPGLFRSTLQINGVRVTDLYTLNSTLGASIEQSVVDNLNALRSIWDPDDKYALYSFVRQAQTFPDVRLERSDPQNSGIILGIELKGWFALAKEGEPSFRYKATPGACAEVDLLVVYPWRLSEVISGTPLLMRPFVTGARYAAEHRNHYWLHMRGKRNAMISPAPHQQPYPRKSEKYLDEAQGDAGGNFGRVARGGIMESFIQEMDQRAVAGIPLGAWRSFFKVFTESFDARQAKLQLDRLTTDWAEFDPGRGDVDETFAGIREVILQLVRTIQSRE